MPSPLTEAQANVPGTTTQSVYDIDIHAVLPAVEKSPDTVLSQSGSTFLYSSSEAHFSRYGSEDGA